LNASEVQTDGLTDGKWGLYSINCAFIALRDKIHIT